MVGSRSAAGGVAVAGVGASFVTLLGEKQSAVVANRVASSSLSSNAARRLLTSKTHQTTSSVVPYARLGRHQRSLFSTEAGSSKSAGAATANTSAKSSSPPPKSPSFMEWYEGHLEASPVLTKMVTGTFLWGIGDAVAQVGPHLHSSSESSAPLEYDYMRTFRAAFYGFAVHAPASHLHFNFLEWMTQRIGATGLGIPIFKTIMEQV